MICNPIEFPVNVATRRPTGVSRAALQTKTAIAAILALPSFALAGPTGGTVVDGSATISQSGAVTNVNQSTNSAIINWRSFSVGSGETVNFLQPSSLSVTLNRVIGNEQSVIAGALNANGRVFLVNSNGVLFTKDAQVNVGGLVASTLDISNSNFKAGNYSFSGSSSAAVVNRGNINAADGGYIALLGKTVSNEGVISAKLGTIALASGDKVTLNFGGDSLVDVTVDQGTLNALIENKGAIKADGGRVLLTAKAADAVLSAQVNNSGVIQARSIADLTGGSSSKGAVKLGRIKLLASGGTTKVSGTLDASAPKGGNGGKIETSGNRVTIADGAVITTKAAKGADGVWLIDPDGFTIGANGDISGATLSSGLANGSVTIASTSGSGSDGNINVNDAVSWSANTLTLNATNNIYVNAVMTATGTANFAANYGHVLDSSGSPTATVSGAGYNADHTPYGLYTLQNAYISKYSYNSESFTGKIDFSGAGSVTLNGVAYTVLNSADDVAAMTPGGNYVLGSDVGLPWQSLTGIGSDSNPYVGAFNGFGHALDVGYQPNGTGLFGTIGATGVVSNLFVHGNIQLSSNNQGASTTDPTVNLTALGILANVNRGSILNSFVAGNVSKNTGSTPDATINDIGGLVGDNYGLIVNSFAAAGVSGTLNIGGFVGVNEASGSIYGSAVRFDNSGVTGSDQTIAYAGGFAGVNSGLISQSYVQAGVQLTDAAVGANSNSLAAGFVGRNTSTGVIDQAYVYFGNYNSQDGVAGTHSAGFVGDNAGTITNSYSAAFASAAGVSAYDSAFAYINSGTIATSYAVAKEASTSSTQSYGFVAINNGGTTTNDYWYTPDQYGDRPSMSDSSTATKLTEDQSKNLASYTGFDPAIWGSSSQGYPILEQMAVLATAHSFVDYGAAGADIVSSLSVAGLQWHNNDSGDTAYKSDFQVAIPSSGYLDAGSYAAGSVLSSPVYANIQGIVTIAPKTLTLASGVVADKTYDGTAVGTINNGLAQGGLIGLVGDQTLNIQYQSANFSDKNAGVNKTATVAFTIGDGANGGKVSNYVVVDTATATINPKAIDASFSAADKTYDGTTQATATTQLNGVITGDSVSLNYASSLFSDKNAGQNKTVTLSGLTLTGGDSGNYVLQSTSVQSTASILPRPLDLYGSETTANSVSFQASNLYAKNAAPGDTVSLTGTVTIAGTTAGVQPITSVSGVTVNNSNYTLVGATGSVLVGTASLALDKVVYGTVTITSSGSATTVTQTTDKAIINWLRFSIGSNESVTFVEPSPTSIVVNVITGNERSVIDGALNANGRVFIVNSNGILFSGTSQVNVGALVATTLNVDYSNFENGVYRFASYGSGSIDVMGQITVANDGFVALASGNGVTTSGSLSAPGGTAVVASASTVALTLDSATPGLAGYALGNLSGVATVGGSLSVAAASGNGGTIETAGDTVALNGSLKVDTGVNGAWSYSQNGDIVIGSGGPFTGQTVAANLATRNLSLNSYNGSVTVDDAVTWSSDERLTLTAGQNININNAVSATGAHAGVTLAYGGFAQTGTAASGFDYYINNLTTANDLSVNIGAAAVTLTGADAGLNINGHAYTLIQTMAQLEALSAEIPGATDYDTWGPAYTIPAGYYALGQDLTATHTYSGPVLQTFVGALAGLGHKISNLTINDSANIGGNGLIGTLTQTKFDWSTFEEVTGPAIVRDLSLVNLSISGQGAGLAASAQQGSSISNVYVQGSIVTGADETQFASNTAGLVGYNSGVIENAHTDIAITVPGAGVGIGGLVGTNFSSIKNSTAKGSIYVGGYVYPSGGFNGSLEIGGLVGQNYGSIDGGRSNVDITANNSTEVGGLVGQNWANGENAAGSITNSSSAGSISSEWLATVNNGNSVGGLVGDNNGGTISGSSSTVNISVKAVKNIIDQGQTVLESVGGLVGSNRQNYNSATGNWDLGGSVSDGSYKGNITAEGAVSGVGGAVGSNEGAVTGIQVSGTLTASQGSTSLYGSQDVGGIVGGNSGGLTNSSSSMNVTGQHDVGGAVGTNTGTVSNVSTSGSVTGADFVGGIAGQNFNRIVDSKSSGNVNGRDNVGGLVGANAYYGMDPNAVAVLEGSTASGNVSGRTNVGGATGFNGGSVVSTVARGNVSGDTNVGGLVGENGGQLFEFGDHLTGAVGAGSAAYGNATGNANVGALIGLNNEGSVVTNASAFGAAYVDNKNTGTLIGLDDGTSSDNTYVNLPAQAAQAAAQAAAQRAQAATGAATVIATTNTELDADSPPGGNMSTAGSKAVYSAAPPKIEDNITIESLAPAPGGAASSERRRHREAANTSSHGHRGSRQEGGGGGRAGVRVRIRSIDIDGHRFDLENKSGGASAPAEAK